MDGSHTIDQPGGKVLGQVKLVFGSSKVIPENKVTSKTEYTNTQQGLPEEGCLNIPLTRHAKACESCGFTFAEKQLRVYP